MGNRGMLGTETMDEGTLVDSKTPTPTGICSHEPVEKTVTPREDGTRGRKRKQSKARLLAGDNMLFPPCKVCGRSATGFHFGVITCEACKAFFRRALIHKQAYMCLGDGSCDVTTAERKSVICSACRLQKCMTLGMSTNSVRKGRYSVALRTQAIVEAKTLRGEDPGVMIATRSPIPSSRAADTTQSLEETKRHREEDTCLMVATRCSPSPSSQVDAVSEDAQSIACSEDRQTRPGKGVQSPSSIQAVFETDASPGSISQIPDALELSVERFVPLGELDLLIDTLVSCQDLVYPNIRRQLAFSRDIQQCQIKTYEELKAKKEMFARLFGESNAPTTEEFQTIFAETGIDVDDRLAHFNMKGRHMEATIAQNINFVKIIPGFRHLCPQDVSKLIKASHMEFWLFVNYLLVNNKLGLAVSCDGSRSSTKEQICKFWCSEWVDRYFRFTDSLHALSLSAEEIALLRVIILTFTDRCSLLKPAPISALQEKFVECLRYQISKTQQNPDTRLRMFMDRLLAVRELTEINMRSNRKFLQEWNFVIQDFPLWWEMLSFDEI
ncbi:nuclear receptor ROR-gamma-like isoform X2 [Mya arenaria]|uniref:nuclear receptor ROR-gamma-like isoform X2 n=1 Tax=Mya arenaria TaxID=6604 RepID=UPI0022E4E55C|nr:nuclear receptor ROR-gamma-like isoform X2 [Mya arenaria]